MKKLFQKSEKVIELFVTGSQNEARGRNIYFNDLNQIYSYGSHYLLAEKLGYRIIMINDTGYSKTTRKHITQITRASFGWKQFFKSETSLGIVYDSVIKNNEKLKKARKPELYTNRIVMLWEKLNEYLDCSHDIYAKSSDIYLEMKNIVGSILLGEEKEELEDDQITEMEELQIIMMN